MDIKFHIEKLGAITDSVIELKPLLLFSGESGTGKSYTAFLIYYFFELYYISDIHNRDIFSIKIKEDVLPISFTEEISFEFIEDDFNEGITDYIGYLIGNKEFECKVKLEISDYLSFDIQANEDKSYSFECDYAEEKGSFDDINDLQSYLDDFVYNCIEGWWGQFKHFLLPPSRGGYLGFPPSVYEKLPVGMYKEFISQLDELLSPSREKNIINPLIEQSLQEIFEGKIEVDNGKLSYSFLEEKIPITAAASSIKELTPLFLLLRKHQPKDCMILWEEPETHLHPSLQRKVAKLVSFLLHHGAYLTITTHSDYFFNQINNLIKLYHVKQKTDEKTFAKLLKTLKIDEQLIINPQQVGAYYFEKQGKTVKIKKQELDTAIPIDSFKKLVDEMLNETDAINDILYES